MPPENKYMLITESLTFGPWFIGWRRVTAYSRPTTWRSTTVRRPSGRSACWGPRQRETPSSGSPRWYSPETSEAAPAQDSLQAATPGHAARPRPRPPHSHSHRLRQARVGPWGVGEHGSVGWGGPPVSVLVVISESRRASVSPNSKGLKRNAEVFLNWRFRGSLDTSPLPRPENHRSDKCINVWDSVQIMWLQSSRSEINSNWNERLAVETAKQHCTVLDWPSRSVSSTMQVQLCGDTLLIDTLGWIRAVFGDPSKPQRPKKKTQTQIMSVFRGTWTITGSTPCNNQGLNIYRDCVLNKPPIKYFLFKPSRCVLLNARQVTPLACRT